jgi:hypothetical protein
MAGNKRDSRGGIGGNGFFADSGTANHLFQLQQGKAVDMFGKYACAVYWKKIPMRNPLNVLAGI